MSKNKLTLMQKRGITGYVFCIPWILGFFLFFLMPVVKTAIYSFNTFDKVTLEPTFLGFKNFIYAFRGDAKFPQFLAGSMIDLLQVPLILIFSYFVALLLRKNFKGSVLVKAIFFLTVILASDLFLRIQNSVGSVNNAQMGSSMEESKEMFAMMEAMDFSKYFADIGISPAIMDFINDAISNIFSVMIHSGVQVFIFLASLHSIPASFYEAANMEGCTAWENFWFITFPMTTPTILINCIYTIVDSFGSYTNDVVQYINEKSFNQFEFGYASALSWIYFLCITIIIAVIYLMFRKKLFFQN